MVFKLYPYFFVITVNSLDWSQNFIRRSHVANFVLVLKLQFLTISSEDTGVFYKEFVRELKDNIVLTRLILKQLFLLSYTVPFTGNNFLRLHSNYVKYFFYTTTQNLPVTLIENSPLNYKVYLTTVSINNLYILYNLQKQSSFSLTSSEDSTSKNQRLR